MRCASCQHDVGDQVRFCERCGAAVGGICRACGAAVPQEARFCAACGVATATGSVASETANVTDALERRQVTIMFCDLVDSTGLSARIDPEELRDVICGYYDICARDISRTGGYIARYSGDGVLAYFGYPVAHEQDAQAAVLAGLAIVEAMRTARAGPAVRVGIHSGLVVAGGGVGAGDRRELLVVGSTPNIAARMQTVARPNSVLISEATYGLVRGFFDCVDLGEQSIKGLEVPVRVWEVRGETGAQSRPEAALKGGLTPLVGREREMATLLECWQQSAGGHGRIVLVSGDAGLGKSRLVHELKKRLAGQAHFRLECRCSPHNESSPLFPIIDLLQRVWGLRRADVGKDRLGRLEDAARQSAAGIPEAVPLLAALLSVSLPDSYPDLELTPQARKRRTLALLVGIICAIAERQPVLFVVEDLHWIDPSTLELLRLVVDRLPGTSIMALLLFRPTFGSPWSQGEAVTRIDIARFGAEETATMVERVAGGRLPAEIVQALCARADGVPLYVEELTKSVLQSGVLHEVAGGYTLVGALTAPAVPMSLADSLMARLDRLAPIREVVQLGATIGRAFSWELMLDVSGLEQTTLQRELARLVEAEILYVRETTAKPTYVFKHALIQDAAYESVPKPRRRRYHLRIAESMERQFPEVVATQPELLGHHWGCAGRMTEAVTYFLLAGRRAYERSAYAEATSHLRRGLSLLEGIADASERSRRELELLLALGPVLVGTRGYSNPEVEAVYARARGLCEQVGGAARLRYAVLSGLLLFHQSRAELATSVELTRQRLSLARELGDPSLEMLVHENFGTLAFWRGEFGDALVSLREALSRYTPEGGRAVRLLYGTDTAVVCTTYEAQALLFLGLPDQALRKAEESVATARELGHLHSLVLALAFAGSLHLQRGEPREAGPLVEEASTLACEQQLSQWIASASVVRADILVTLGRAEEGIAEFFAGLAAFQASGATISGRYFVARLAEAHLAAGRAEEGLGLFERMLPLLVRCEDVFYDPEVARTWGRLLLATSPGDPEPAEARYREALGLARRYGSKFLELRAATSLAGLWRTLGRCEEARRLLVGVHGGFSEGFTTRDLRDAAALLADLTVQPDASAGFIARTST